MRTKVYLLYCIISTHKRNDESIEIKIGVRTGICGMDGKLSRPTSAGTEDTSRLSWHCLGIFEVRLEGLIPGACGRVLVLSPSRN